MRIHWNFQELVDRTSNARQHEVMRRDRTQFCVTLGRLRVNLVSYVHFPSGMVKSFECIVYIRGKVVNMVYVENIN